MKKQVSLLTLTAALLLGACSTYEEVPATSGDGATAVGFLADIAPREQSRADINVDFGTGLTGTWNGEDKLGVLANDFSKLLQFTYTTDSKAFTGSLSGSADTWAYRAFYPHNGNATVSGTTVTVPFSALRTQNGNKYNSEFDIMAADAITHNNAKPGKTPEGNAVKFNLHRITSILALKLQGGAASEKIASVMLTSKKPIASEKLTFTVPSDPNAAYDPSAITPKLVAEGTSATGSPISIDSEHITVTYADGTAPHVLEAVTPGAAGLYLDLGQFYDRIALQKERRAIELLQTRYRALYREAYARLAAFARPSCPLPAQEERKRRFLRAVTCRGLYSAEPPAGAVQLVSGEELEALRARETAILYQNPLFPDETEAVYLPDEKRYYRGPDTPLPDLSDVTALLAQAKALHDELEAIYNPHVDFARVYALANSHALRLFKEN